MDSSAYMTLHRDKKSTDISLQIDYSVIIPAFKGSDRIAECIESVQHALAGKKSEIIVVESSRDETRNIIKQQFPTVKLVESEERLSAGGARNLGASIARGKLLFFVDQDCVVPTNWIQKLAYYLTDLNVGAAGGSVGIRNMSNLSGCGVYFLEFLNHFPRKKGLQRNQNFLVGCNLACRAEIFKTINFPDRTLAEDVLFSHALRKAGLDIIYDPSISVRHWNRSGWKEFLRYNKKMGKAAAAYHQFMSKKLIKPFLRFPILTFVSPVVILPKIFLNLLFSNWIYLLYYILLLPVCLIGNIFWAASFRSEILANKTSDMSPQKTDKPKRVWQKELL